MKTHSVVMLSAILLSLACVRASAVDSLIYNVNGYTLDKNGELKRFDTLWKRDGKVVAIGMQAEMTKDLGELREAIARNGEGKTLLPGLIDAHGHIMGLGHSLSQVDLVGTRSLEDAQERVRTYAKANPQARWIRGRGWNQEIWKLGRFPTSAELDGVVSDRPAWLKRVDGHAGWANAATLKLAGITAETRDPEGGRIERDAQGSPTGVLVDAAMDLVDAVVPRPTREESEVALAAAMKQLASVGLTSVHDAGIDAATFAMYEDYAAKNRLSLRINAMIGGAGEDFDAIVKQRPKGDDGSGFLSVRSVKLYADGALGSRGAALLEPYSDSPGNKGLLFQSDPSLQAQVDKALRHKMQVCVHAIGDAGNRQVLDAYARARLRGDARPRIEHAQVVGLADIARFKELGVIASMQPTHATSDMNMAEKRVGPERIKGAYAWRRMLQAGVRLAAGSDFPVESTNPFWGLHAAVTRQDHHNLPEGGWYPDQALTVKEALRAFTLDAAYAGYQEKQLGSLEPGKQADFILVDRDIFTADPKTLWQARVLETWVAGRRVHPQ
ncbi:MAG: amidohydrolase [Gammaproteobacteria bacterium]